MPVKYIRECPECHKDKMMSTAQKMCRECRTVKNKESSNLFMKRQRAKGLTVRQPIHSRNIFYDNSDYGVFKI